MKYKIRQSTKGTVWVDDYFEVEADSLKEAKEKVLEGMCEPYGTETNWESWYAISPEENGGCRTCGLYDGTDLIYKNGK